MTSPSFVGRKQELAKLSALYKRAAPSLVVLKGRRRIGKSRLVAEFAAQYSQHTLWSFAGLAPEAGMTAQTERDYFARQLATILKIPPMTFQDWTDAFLHLSLHIKAGDIIFFDEISWMGHNDPSFVPKLKAWWDTQTLPVLFVFCSSISTWIEDNILNSTAFFGRVALTMTLEPLTIPESTKLLRLKGFQGSAYETYQLLGILGGVPWYLEQVSKGISFDTIIKQLCFEKDGLLVLEFDRVFHDLFNGKGKAYQKILNVLKEGPKTLAEIRLAIQFARSGTLSQLMEHLIVAGFVRKQNLWSFKTSKPLKQSLYHISDPYIRFYLKVIEGHRTQINLGAFHEVPPSRLPGFEAHMGLQLESLLLQNRPLLLKAMDLLALNVVNDERIGNLNLPALKDVKLLFSANNYKEFVCV